MFARPLQLSQTGGSLLGSAEWCMHNSAAWFGDMGRLDLPLARGKLEMSPEPGNVARQNRKYRPPKSSLTLHKHIITRVLHQKKCPRSVGCRYRFWRPPRLLHDHTTLIIICVCHMLSTRIKCQSQPICCFTRSLCCAQ